MAAHHPSYVELKLDRRFYRPGDLVTGVATVVTSKPKRFEYVRVSLEGKTELEVSPRDVGLFDAFYSPPEPVLWIRRQLDVSKNGTFNVGRNVFTFEFALAPSTSHDLLETLKGLCIRTTYNVTVNVNRGFSSRVLSTECELYVQVPRLTIDRVLPETSKQFRFNNMMLGEIQTYCSLQSPIAGHLMIVASDNGQSADFISVELELVRIEDVAWGEDAIREICVVQTTQVADGTLPAGATIPFFFIVPRLVVSPTYDCSQFQVSYAMNILLLVKGSTEVLSRSVPITFYR